MYYNSKGVFKKPLSVWDGSAVLTLCGQGFRPPPKQKAGLGTPPEKKLSKKNCNEYRKYNFYGYSSFKR